MMARRVFLLLSLLLLVPFARAANPSGGLHAFLDRDHAALGDTVTLNIEGPAALSAAPDLSPLQADFDVLGTSSSSRVQIVNGTSQTSTQLGIALRPKHAGALTIPPLQIGSERTQPLTLQVTPAPTGAQGGPGDPAFLEASVDSPAPYVGQQDVYTLKLFYAGSLTGGQLEDPQADGAQVIHLNGDTRYQTTRNGQTYQVVERRYALVPERSGRIVVRGPTFMGQMLGDGGSTPFDNFFDEGKPVQARADDIALDVRAAPAGAGKPWLPAQSVQLKLSGMPSDGQVKLGEPLSLTLSVEAVGQPADHLPQPQLPALGGARVYPDKTQDSTRDDGRWLHGTRTRTFAIVPDRAGPLTIPAITLNWWNVAQDRAEQARVPAHTLTVIGAMGGNIAAPATPAAAGNAQTAPVATPTHAAMWRAIAIASLALWAIALTALAWWWRLRRRNSAIGTPGSGSAVRPGNAHELHRRTMLAVRECDVAACERALLEWARAARPHLRNLGELHDALAGGSQRAALEQLERVRWKGGDAPAACAAVAHAFERGFVWNETHDKKGRAGDGLPPLYPNT
ncbi:MAG: BatD family protein [Rhodanobacteraceae bacterium]